MTIATLPKNCDISGLVSGLNSAGAFRDDWESAVLQVPDHGRVDAGALAFLCAWGKVQVDGGRHIVINGYQPAIDNMARLGLQAYLGLAYQFERPVNDPSVPLRPIVTERDVVALADAVRSLINKHFDAAETFLPALDWAVCEILDNVLRHADSKVPGAGYAEYIESGNKIVVGISDLGKGIKATLGKHVALFSHGHAITEAIKRGVTRSEEIGQGNGLAGTLEIVNRNRGNLTIWTGNAAYKISNGGSGVFSEMPEVAGTGVLLELDTRSPVDLEDTWIATAGVSFLKGEKLGGGVRPDEPGAPNATGTSVLSISQECESTSMRGPAQRLRERVQGKLFEGDENIILDFTGVRHASSSFLDELLGRLAQKLGPELFHARIEVREMSTLVGKMADAVIEQRLSKR